MFYNVEKLKDVVELDEKLMTHKILLEDEQRCIKAIALKKEELIDTHTSERDTMIYIIDGKIEIHFEAEKFELEKGEYLLFKKDATHKVLANKDSKFLLIQ